MDILSYVQGIPTFKKNDLIDRVDVTQTKANDLKNNITRMEANKIRLDNEVNSWAITKSIVRSLESDGYRGVTFDHAIIMALTSAVSVTEGLTKLIRKDSSSVWSGDLINLRQANILNTLEHIDHFLKYTSFLYDVLITKNNKKAKDAEGYLQKTDLRFLSQTLEYYKGTLIFLLKGSNQIINDLEKIPEVEVNETSLSVLEGIDGKTNMELVRNGFAIHEINPKYWYKLVRMNMHTAEIEEARTDNETFAMKISQATNLKNGVNDAELDERILTYQDEIIKNVARIKQIEARYA